MRIAQITESLEVGGAERVAVSIANGFSSSHTSAVICIKREGALAEDLNSDVELACLNKAEGHHPLLPWRLARTLRALRADVVHLHDWGVFVDAVLAARLAGVRAIVHTVHGQYMHYPPGVLSAAKKRTRHWVERRVAGNVSIACVSEDLRLHVHREVGLPLGSLRTVPNGVRIGAAPQRTSQRGEGVFRFISVGRLVPVKNVQMQLEAFALLGAVQPRVHLQIVGDGPERQDLQERARALGVSNCVEFLGFRGDIEALLAQADAFILTSRSEGIPMSILEAMCSGLPVIATHVGGVPSLVENGRSGVLIENDDAPALAAAMGDFVAQADLAIAMGRAGYQRARENFSIQSMLTAYERLYDAALHRDRLGEDRGS